MTILAMNVTVLTGQYAGPTHGAGWAGTERIIEDDATFGKVIDTGHLKYRIPVAFSKLAPVIGNKKHNVSMFLGHGWPPPLA